MARLPNTFNFGDVENDKIEDLMLRLEEMYTLIATAVNSKPDLYQRSDDGVPGAGDGQVGDTFLSQGSININLSTNKVEMLTNHPTATTVTWTTLS